MNDVGINYIIILSPHIADQYIYGPGYLDTSHHKYNQSINPAKNEV